MAEPSRKRRRRKGSVLNRLGGLLSRWMTALVYTLWHAPLRTLSDWLRHWQRAPARLLRGVAHGMRRLLDSVWLVLVLWPLKALSAWRTSSSLRYLAGGLPALLLLFGVLSMVVLVRRPIDRGSRYYVAAIKAFSKGDYEASRIYHDRLLEIQGPRGETLFNLMLIAEQLGDQERFSLLLNRLAPLDHLVHGPAHLRKAQILMASVAGPDDFERLTRAETHLQHALRANPDDQQVHAELGYVYMMTSQPGLAIKHLLPIVDARPDFLLLLAQAYVLVGDAPNAYTYAVRSQQHYRQATAEEPSNPAPRIDWAQATSFLEEFPQAIDILKRGAVAGDEASYQQPLVGVYIAWFDYLLRQPQPDKAAMVQVLQDALAIAPNHTSLFQRVMTVLEFEGESADQIRAQLNQMLAEGGNTPLLHVLLGTDAGMQGDLELAIRHLEIAVKLDPEMLYAANNLAWYLAHRDTPDLETASEIIDVVAQRWPDNAYILETRGQILARQGRYADALIDLKKALTELNDYRPLHVTLAKVYREMKMEALAVEHENRAKKLPEGGKQSP